MGCRDKACITVTRGQIKAALGKWHEDCASEGVSYRPSEAEVEEQADYLMMLCREQGAK